MNLKLRVSRAGLFLALALAAGMAVACGAASQSPPDGERAAPTAAAVAPAAAVRQEPAAKAVPAEPAAAVNQEKPAAEASVPAATASQEPAVRAATVQPAATAIPEAAVKAAPAQPAATTGPGSPIPVAPVPEPAVATEPAATAAPQSVPAAPAATPAPAAPTAAVATPTPADPPPEIGRQVGYRIPDFTLDLAEGGTVTAADLIAAGRPAFLFFFATTWGVCTAELRRLKDIYPEYAAAVDFYAVGTFSKRIESLETLENYRQRQGHPWPVANPSDAAVLQDLGITVQSTKIAFDGNGVITYRDGFGGGDPAVWRQVLADLAQIQ